MAHKLVLTEKQLETIKASLLVTLQVTSRQQYNIPSPPKVSNPQMIKERIRDVFETIGYVEGLGFSPKHEGE